MLGVAGVCFRVWAVRVRHAGIRRAGRLVPIWLVLGGVLVGFRSPVFSPLCFRLGVAFLLIGGLCGSMADLGLYWRTASHGIEEHGLALSLNLPQTVTLDTGNTYIHTYIQHRGRSTHIGPCQWPCRGALAANGQAVYRLAGNPSHLMPASGAKQLGLPPGHI